MVRDFRIRNSDFKPANIHAGGLRYHGAGMIISQLLKDGYDLTHKEY